MELPQWSLYVFKFKLIQQQTYFNTTSHKIITFLLLRKLKSKDVNSNKQNINSN